MYNSAAFFQTATTVPYLVGGKRSSTVYLASGSGGQRLAMKANRVPAAVDITIITIGSNVLNRRPLIPNQQNIPIIWVWASSHLAPAACCSSNA